ncbi:hypothetical protein CsNV_006 [Callinectes sapidus nudivirus]|nr:hypothetical protein CsNV_006 [Callinectes sapidus nudivirus]
MIVFDTLQVTSLIFALPFESRELSVVEFIKLKEFQKHSQSLNLYSLQYQFHKHSNYYIVNYCYATNPNESTYDNEEDDHQIAIRVPYYTDVQVTLKHQDSLVAKPPDGKRKIIQKTPKAKRQKRELNGETSSKNTPAVFTSYVAV